MRAFLYLIGAQTKRVLQYRTDAVTCMLVSALRVSAGFAIIFTVYGFIPEIEGIDRWTCVLIFAAYSLVTSTFYTFFPWTLWYSRRYIVEGRLLLILTKPLHPMLFIIGEGFGREEVLETCVSFALFVFASIMLHASVLQTVVILLCLIPGVLTIAGLYLIVAAIASRVHTAEQAFSPITELSDFAQYPISIYPRTVQFILLWVIPYSLIAFIPIAVARGIPVQSIPFKAWWLPLYGIVIFALGVIAFRRSLSRFETTGS